MVTKELFDIYFDNLLKGNRSECARIIQSLLDQETPLKSIYSDLFQASMYEVGRLWEFNKIPVSVEHLATAVTESLLTLVYPILFETPRIGKSMVMSCVVNEYHQLGAKIVADYFEFFGWDSYFLGANTPVKDLLEMIETKRPDVVGLSVAVYSTMSSLVDVLDQLKASFPDMPVMLGGQAFAWGEAPISGYSGVTLVKSFDELEAWLRNDET